MLIQVTAEGVEFAEAERVLSGIDVPGVDLRDVEPYAPNVRSALLHSVVISVSSAAGLKAVKDVLVTYLQARRASVKVKTPEGGEVEFEGPLRNQQEVLRLVDALKAEEPPKRVEP